MTYISNTFPTAIQTGTDPIGTDEMFTFDHAGLENFQNDSILALKNKVGVDGSAVNTSHDYKLSGVATGDKAVSKTGTETLTNKTLTSPIITGGSVENTNISGTFTIAGTITDSGNYTHSGTNTFTGATTFNTSLPTSSLTPTNSSDLTTKAYVDNQALPSQTGKNGKYLRTNGSSSSWETLSLFEFTAGESITGATAPVPVSLSTYQSDGGILLDSKVNGSFSITTGGFSGNTSNITVAANSNKKLVIAITWIGNGAISTVKWNTTESMTLAKSQTYNYGGVDFKIYIYYLDNPTATTAAVSIVGSGDGSHSATGQYAIYSYYNTLTGIGSTDGHSDSSGNIVTVTNTITPAGLGSKIISAAITGSTSSSIVNIGSNQYTASGYLFGDGGIVFPVKSTSFSLTTSNSALASVEIKPFTTAIYAVKKSSSSSVTNIDEGNLYTTFVGFATTTASANASITIQTNSIVGGFSGLVAGSIYYINDTAGTIGTTAGSNTKKVGLAVSTTELLIENS